MEGGKFSAAVIPKGHKIVREYDLSTHTFYANMKIIGSTKETIYFKDMESLMVYQMSTKNFITMVKETVLINGFICGVWGWSYHHLRTTIKLIEQREE